MIDERALLNEMGLTGAGFAAPLDGCEEVGFAADELVAPASVMKIQIGLAVQNLIGSGAISGAEVRTLPADDRVPGPVGMSLMRDEVSMSVRDLVVAMLTISDNVATDELIDLVGVAEINGLTERLGLTRTKIVSGLRDQLDAIAKDAGFDSYSALAARDPSGQPPHSEHEIRAAIRASAGLDPRRWTRTTARETVQLLQAIWNDTAGPAIACAAIRHAMAHQLVMQRIASGFDSTVGVAAKSGGLLGVVRNEAGVVTLADGHGFAVAVFTRRADDSHLEPKRIDAAIGTIARSMIERLRRT